MKRLLCLLLVFFCFSSVLPFSKARASDYNNPLFAYPHLLPSPFTLPAGRFVIGTSSAVGLTNFLQVGTNLIRDFYKVFNANAKLSMFDFDVFALALYVEGQTFNLNDISDKNPDVRVYSLMPGIVTSYALGESLALFVGGNWSYTQVKVRYNDIVTSGFVHGAAGEVDLSWAYSGPKKADSEKEAPTKKRAPSSVSRGPGNVLSVGTTYDFTYRIYGVGISHHWPSLQLGIHYYPNAEKFQLQPIIAGGAVIDI